MAVNKPTGDNARKGAVKKRSQLATKTMGKKPGPSGTGRPANSWIRRKPQRRRNSRVFARNGEGKLLLVALAIGTAGLIGLSAFLIHL